MLLEEKGGIVYSSEAEELVQRIMDGFTDLNFKVFESIQLNDFVNHPIVHNTIFIQMENDLQEFVFDILRIEYPGGVMLRPGVDEYYRYLQENEIIVGRLPSEAPKGVEKYWHSRHSTMGQRIGYYSEKLVLLAPTELNKQKFIIRLNEDETVDFIDKSGTHSQTDLGIVRCHFEIGAGRSTGEIK